jgi:hypothetical protein
MSSLDDVHSLIFVITEKKMGLRLMSHLRLKVRLDLAAKPTETPRSLLKYLLGFPGYILLSCRACKCVPSIGHQSTTLLRSFEEPGSTRRLGFLLSQQLQTNSKWGTENLDHGLRRGGTNLTVHWKLGHMAKRRSHTDFGMYNPRAKLFLFRSDSCVNSMVFKTSRCFSTRDYFTL